MLRRTFLSGELAALALAKEKRDSGNRLAKAAEDQPGVTTGYDSAYTRITYRGGNVPRS
jgi:uncharacterized protein YijF (DUF1287 family)